MNKKFTIKYRVYYEDTDAGGVVYYGNYLKFAERARSDMFRLSGYNHVSLAKEHNCFFVVKTCNIDYQMPARLDDEITVDTSVKKMGSSSVILQQDFYNQNGEPLAKAEVTIVCVRNEGKKIKSVKIIEEIKDFFLSYV